MKKIVVLILTFLMTFGLIHSSFAVVSADADDLIKDGAYSLSVYAEDAVIDEATNTATVYIDISRVPGYFEARFEIVYPECLSVVSVEDVFQHTDHYEADWRTSFPNKSAALLANRLEGFDISANEILKCKENETEGKMTFIYNVYYLDPLEEEVPTFSSERLLKYVFSYDPEADTEKSGYLPIIILPETESGLPGGANPDLYPSYSFSFFGATVSVPSLTSDHDHNWILSVTEPVTCFSMGNIEYVCEGCGEEKEVLYFGNHSFTEEVVVSPLCETEGYNKVICENCGYCISSKKVTMPLGHDFSNTFTIDREPNYNSPGEKSRHCSRCSEVIDATEVGYLPGDSDGDGKVTSRDLSQFKKIIAGVTGEGSFVQVNCGIDGDGKTNSRDLSALKRLIAQG